MYSNRVVWEHREKSFSWYFATPSGFQLVKSSCLQVLQTSFLSYWSTLSPMLHYAAGNPVPPHVFLKALRGYSHTLDSFLLSTFLFLITASPEFWTLSLVLFVRNLDSLRQWVLIQVWIMMINKSFLRVLVEEEATDGWPFMGKEQDRKWDVG